MEDPPFHDHDDKALRLKSPSGDLGASTPEICRRKSRELFKYGIESSLGV